MNLLDCLGRPINFSYDLINSVIPRSFYWRDTYLTLIGLVKLPRVNSKKCNNTNRCKRIKSCYNIFKSITCASFIRLNNHDIIIQ
jgi:hypothetical protein